MDKESINALRILIVDDDLFALEVISDHLQHLGISKIITAPSGEEALRTLASESFDLLLCDLHMPKMDGIELMRHIADRGFAGGILLFSGVDVRVRNSAIGLGESLGLNMLGSLEKPVHQAQLASALADFTERRKPAAHHAKITPITAEECRTGLAAGCLKVYVQPKVCARTRTLLGAECLSRWQHPTRGLLGPDCFIAVFEQENLIDDLTFAVLADGVAALAKWHSEGLDINISLNLSIKRLTRLDFPELLDSMVRDAGMTPERITLEVVESGLMSSFSAGMDILTRLRLKGFGLSVDDFGTGYSTLARIQQMPFTELKLDQSFVRHSTDDATARAILKSSIRLGKKLHLRLVAEGVETEEQWKLVASSGCEEIQGYLIARPMPLAEFPLWAHSWQHELTLQDHRLSNSEDSQPERHVLLIDDDLFTHELIRDELSPNFRLSFASSPATGLQMAAELQPDLILLDIDMPEQDGFAVCRALREMDSLDSTPVIFISGLEDIDDRLKAYDAGGNDYLPKPTDSHEIKAKIDQLINAREAYKQTKAMADYAGQAAMTAMSSMSEMGTLIQTLQRFNACSTATELADALLGGLAQYGLKGAAQISLSGEKVARNDSGDASPLERSVLDHIATMERIVTFKTRLSIHHGLVSLLITNLPTENEDYCGRLRDHLATMAESADVRARAMAAMLRAEQQDAAIDRTAGRIIETLGAIDQGQRTSRNETSIAIQQFKETVQRTLHGMAISDAQEEHMMNTIERGIDTVLDAQTSETDTQDKLTAIVDELRRLTQSDDQD